MCSILQRGVIEAFNHHGEEFGEERLVDALRRYRGLPAQALAGAVVDQVQRFSACDQYDDMSNARDSATT